MFFDAEGYLESDPAQARSERERGRLWRSATQRAKLCEATTRLAAREEGWKRRQSTWLREALGSRCPSPFMKALASE